MRRATAALAVLTALAAMAAAPASAAPKPTANVTAYGPHHERLAGNPMLFGGERIQIVVIGFGPNVEVTVRGTASAPYRHQHADRTGTVRVQYVVPVNAQPGPHVVSFAGAPTSMPTPAFDPADGGNPANVRATVPVYGLFPYRTAPHSRTHSGRGAGGSGLGFTGFPVLAALAIGLAALSAGFAVTRAGRRRRAPRLPSER